MRLLPALCTTTVALLSAVVPRAGAGEGSGVPGSGGHEPATARIVVDQVKGATPVPPEIFGINANWVRSGDAVIECGEMIRDRSFRSPMNRGKWQANSDKSTNGSITRIESGGDDQPWGGKGYPGYLRLAQAGAGSTGICQLLLGSVKAGERYELHLSAKAEEGAPALSVFLVDKSFLPITPHASPTPIKDGAWRDYRFVMEPSTTQTPGILRIVLAGAGAVGIDEIRLQRAGAEPRVQPLARERIRELGVRALRWPGGTDADFFDWREAVGPVRNRGENVDMFGSHETASLGLHEFLDFCETERLVPLITVNVKQPSESSADLLEYILGPATSPMGALRARNGRQQPWRVTHFELGNEPSENYRLGFSKDQMAKGYVQLAKTTAEAMRTRADGHGKTIELMGILETGFAIADWIKAVPMLADWNAIVLDPRDGLRSSADRFHGHFYSFFGYRSSERELFEEIMGGGATLARTLSRLEEIHGAFSPFWLTEYGVMVQQNNPTKILIDRLKDAQSGLAAADLLITAVQEHLGGAFLFNLAEAATFGVMRNDVDFALRPAGLAFSMLSPLSGKPLAPVRIEGGGKVVLKGADGHNPANLTYPTLATVVTCAEGETQVVILNRSYDRQERVEISGVAASKRAVHRLESARLTDHNENQPSRVAIIRSDESMRDAPLVTVNPRSLVRIIYTSNPK